MTEVNTIHETVINREPKEKFPVDIFNKFMGIGVNGRTHVKEGEYERLIHHAMLLSCGGLQALLQRFCRDTAAAAATAETVGGEEGRYVVVKDQEKKVAEIARNYYENEVYPRATTVDFAEDLPHESWGPYEHMKQLEYLQYDLNEFKMRDIATRILLEADGFGMENRTLETLHVPYQDEKGSVQKVSTFMSNQRTAHHVNFYNSEHLPEFLAEYRRFVKEYIAPKFSSEKELIFQARPTFRVQMPGNQSIGCMHIDAVFMHPGTEINFWLPLSKVYGHNTLWSESEPNKGDFKPFTCDPGTVVRFYGSRVRHFDVPNIENTTRVSIDFRVIPMSIYEKAQSKLTGGTTANEFVSYKIGSYYAKLNVETGKITGTDNDAIFDKRAEAWRAEKLGAAETPVAKKHKV